MSVKDILKIAYRNLIAGKQMIKKMVFGMIFVIMILFCFFMVIKSYDDYVDKFNNEHVADRYYYTEIELEDISENTIVGLLQQSEKMKQEFNATGTSILCNIAPKDENINMNAGNIRICIDDVEYKAKNYYINQRKLHQDIRGSMWPIWLGLYQDGMSVFSETILSSYMESHSQRSLIDRLGKDIGYKTDNNKNDNKNVNGLEMTYDNAGYMIGLYPNKQGEIMLDSYILEVYGIEITEDIIGSNVTIYSVDDENSSVVLSDYKLTGIFDGDLISSRESTLTSDNHIEHIYVNLRGDDRGSFRNLFGTIRYYFDDYAEYVNNYKYMTHVLQMNIDELMETDVSLTGHGMEYYILYWIMENIGKLLILVGGVLGLIITVSVLYIFQFYRDRNARYISMLQHIGMTKKDRTRIYAVEMSMVILIASIIGLYMSVIFLLLLNVVTGQVLNFTVVFDVTTGVVALLTSWIYFALCLWFIMHKRNKMKYAE